MSKLRWPAFTLAVMSLAFTGAHADNTDRSQVAPPESTQQQNTAADQRPQEAATGAESNSGSSGTSGTSGSSGSKATGDTRAAGGAQAAGGGQSESDVVYMLFPVEVAAGNSAMSEGCWARVYSGENFTGDALTLVGPTAVRDMDRPGPFGIDWDDRVNSIETGPKATVTVFDNENFRDQVAQFRPNQRVADLSRRLGFFDEFASINVVCQQG